MGFFFFCYPYHLQHDQAANTCQCVNINAIYSFMTIGEYSAPLYTSILFLCVFNITHCFKESHNDNIYNVITYSCLIDASSRLELGDNTVYIFQLYKQSSSCILLFVTIPYILDTFIMYPTLYRELCHYTLTFCNIINILRCYFISVTIYLFLLLKLLHWDFTLFFSSWISQIIFGGQTLKEFIDKPRSLCEKKRTMNQFSKQPKRMIIFLDHSYSTRD